MTKFQEGLVENYNRANATDLFDVYARPSANKWRAWQNCMAWMRDLNGYDGRICSYNTFKFSFAFKFMEGGVEKMMYLTADHNREIVLA